MAVIKSEPLTYHQHEKRYSYFRDLVLSETVPDAADRLQRHAKEMDVLNREREERAWRGMRAGDFEYRVEPNRTDGTGGYFTVPAWLNQFFATAKRPARTLGSLIPATFELPAGISSVNLPILGTGTEVQPVADTSAVPAADITDTPGSSTVVTLTGMVDTSLQMLEQCPAGAPLDYTLFKDMSEAADAQLEDQLLTGLGTVSNSFSASPT